MNKIIDRKLVEKGMSYDAYRQLSNELLKQGKVTGIQQSDELAQYARLHVHRMQRIDNSLKLLPETVRIIQEIASPQVWMVLTESWCGDAAQIVPIINAFTKVTDKIDFRLMMRDDNPELMDLYLTHGKSRSIPKLIAVKFETMEELFHWGPRPTALQELMNKWVADEWPFEEMKEELHLWYARDEGVSVQNEITELLAKSI